MRPLPLMLAVLCLGLAVPCGADRVIDGAGKRSLRLPSGLELRRDPLRVVQGKLSAPLPLPRPERMAAEIDSVVLKADGALSIQFGNFCRKTTVLEVAPRGLEARLANAEGLALRGKGDVPGAAGAFRRALAADPDLVEAAAHLAAALVATGSAAEAGRVVAAAARAPVALYPARLGVAHFPALQGLPEVAKLRAATPGTSVMPLENSATFPIAAQPGTGLLAFELSDGGGGCECCTGSELLIVDPRTEAVVAALPLEAGDDWAQTPSSTGACQVRRQRAAAQRQRLATAGQLLRDLGFAPVPGAERVDLESVGSDIEHRKGAFPKGRIGVAIRLGRVRALRGDSTLGQATFHGFARSATYLPGPGLILLTGEAHHQEGCAGTDAPVFGLLRLAAAPR